MDSSIALNPFLWATVSGVALGAAAGSLLRPARPGRGSRLVPCFLWLTVAVTAATAGLLATGLRFADAGVGLFALALCAVTALGLRFPRAVGIPALAVVVLVSGVAVAAGAGCAPVPADRVVAAVTVIAPAAPGSIETLRFDVPGGEAYTVSVTGPSCAADLSLVSYEAPWFFMGTRDLFRWTGYRTGGSTVAWSAQGDRTPFPEPGRAGSIAGISRVKVAVPLDGLAFPGSYRILLGPDGKVTVTERR